MSSDAGKPPLKGILKKPKAPQQTDLIEELSALSPQNPTKPDPRAIAIQHAQLLEDRKNVEAQIFDNIITLLDYPLHPSRPPAHAPDPSDTDAFLSLVRILQPSDYDDLIVERNLDGDKCGYTLCPNKRRRFPNAGTYKFINKGRKDFDIVETKELEKWCSPECTRRALWIKVQLNETAAWERIGLPDLKLEIYPGKQQADQSGGGDSANASSREAEAEHPRADTEPQRLAKEMARLQLEQDRKADQDAAALALERGDHDTQTRTMNLVIREKKVATVAEPPSLPTDDCDAVEGYKSKFGAV